MTDWDQIHHLPEQLLLGHAGLGLRLRQVNQLPTGGGGSLGGIFITI